MTTLAITLGALLAFTIFTAVIYHTEADYWRDQALQMDADADYWFEVATTKTPPTRHLYAVTDTPTFESVWLDRLEADIDSWGQP